MTTGTRTINRTWVGTSYCGRSTTFGEMITKTWSGTDTPKTRPAWSNVYDHKTGLIRRVWRKPPRRQLKRPENSYSMSLVRVNDPPMFMKIGVPPVWQQGSVKTCYGGGSNWPTDPITANEKNQLIAKLRESIVHSDFNVGVFLAEGHQSLQMIGDTATKLARSFRLMRRGRPDLAWRQLLQSPGPVPKAVRRLSRKDLDTVVLELQYGWVPLVNDLYEAAKSFAHFAETPCSKSYRVAIRRTGPWPTAQYSGYQWLYGKNEARRQIIARVVEVNVPKMVGVTDPAQVLWEKLPWSFLADWILPIGSFLSARGVANSLTGTFITSHKWHRAAGKPAAVGAWTINAPGYVEERIDFDRIVSTSLVAARPTIKPLSKVASWQHAVNGLALLSQVLRN